MEQASEHLDMNEWVVVGTANEAKFLGRVSYVKKDIELTVIEALKGDILTLCPALDFFAPVQQDGSQLHRRPVVVPVDFVLAGVPVHIRPVFAYLCRDMQEQDRNAYKGFVEKALALAAASRGQRDEGESSGGIKH